MSAASAIRKAGSAAYFQNLISSSSSPSSSSASTKNFLVFLGSYVLLKALQKAVRSSRGQKKIIPQKTNSTSKKGKKCGCGCGRSGSGGCCIGGKSKRQ